MHTLCTLYGIKELCQHGTDQIHQYYAGCPSIGKTEANPLVINSTAMDKIIKPNTRVITFIPVVPSKPAIFSAINKQSSTAKATVAITQTASTS